MIYVDNAATTPLKPEVLEKMTPYLTERFGNPSSIYKSGRDAKVAVNTARAAVAESLGAEEHEIYFTGSGSEADNWAVKGVAHAGKGKHIITSAVEHHAVLHAAGFLERNGYEVTYLPVDGDGLVDPDDLRTAIRGDTALVSVMTANNEIGTVQPIAALAAIARERRVPFHTDAVQAFGQIPVDVGALGVDLLSVSAHKLGGPKGVGALYIRKGTKISPLIHGGAQENGKRASTENVAGIVGFAHASELAMKGMNKNTAILLALRDDYIKKVRESVPYCRLNGHPTKRLPGNANFSFEFIEGESLLLMLDMKGIEASSGSACTSGSLDPSHVLLAIGLPHDIAHGSLRVSLSADNTQEDVDTIVAELRPIVQRLRDMSPLYEGIKK
ncbi:MAG: cysteine desulfurase NifS [Clostridiales bacterium]|jgi:cysteine desulfurase|nr:cysteine desulfurase NifS [Clostridiales bacterium]